MLSFCSVAARHLSTRLHTANKAKLPLLSFVPLFFGNVVTSLAHSRALPHTTYRPYKHPGQCCIKSCIIRGVASGRVGRGWPRALLTAHLTQYPCRELLQLQMQADKDSSHPLHSRLHTMPTSGFTCTPWVAGQCAHDLAAARPNSGCVLRNKRNSVCARLWWVCGGRCFFEM